jgi:hypothetical protein
MRKLRMRKQRLLRLGVGSAVLILTAAVLAPTIAAACGGGGGGEEGLEGKIEFKIEPTGYSFPNKGATKTFKVSWLDTYEPGTSSVIKVESSSSSFHGGGTCKSFTAKGSGGSCTETVECATTPAVGYLVATNVTYSSAVSAELHC